MSTDIIDNRSSHNVDNNEYLFVDTSLFQDILLKGFKGKGNGKTGGGITLSKYQKLLRQFEEQQARISEDMDELVREFDLTFRPPRIVNLRPVRRKNSKTLYWRLPGVNGDQKYTRLFQTEAGIEFLNNNPQEFVSVLKTYEQRRLDVNLRYSVSVQIISSLNSSIENMRGVRNYR